MDQIIHATFVDGVFKPAQPVNLPAGTEVTIVVPKPRPQPTDAEWEEFERFCDENAGYNLPRLTRDELHDRRL
jgi:predicted DNA-binding antitoxin AbrB/MazE fold protein